MVREHSLYDFSSFKYVKAGFMSQDTVSLCNCSCALEDNVCSVIVVWNVLQMLIQLAVLQMLIQLAYFVLLYP